MMGPAKALTNNQIEPLFGDPLSGFDCTIEIYLSIEQDIRRGFNFQKM